MPEPHDRALTDPQAGATADGGDGRAGEGQVGDGQTGEGQVGDGQTGEGQVGDGQAGDRSLWAGWDSEFVTSWWVAGFTEGADPEYEEQILPLAATHLAGASRVLDVGCGEGQVARLAAGLLGAGRTTGVDPTGAQLRVAASRGAEVSYARATATQLPFPPSSFDAVVACLVFEHIDDVDTAIAEVGRVLAPGGRFLLFLNHPLLQAPGSGWIDDRILGEQYWRIGPYLTEDSTLEQVDNGVWIPFVHRPLARYVNALVEQGMVITRMEEPAPPPGFLALAEEYREAATIPRLLFMRAEKVSLPAVPPGFARRGR